MADNMSDLVRASIEGMKQMADRNTVFGSVIETPGGVTVIPVSRVRVGFATGGADVAGKKPLQTNFGGGGGSAVSVTPVAFLTVSPNAEVKLIPVDDSDTSKTVDRIADLIESSPLIIEKIKKSLFG